MEQSDDYDYEFICMIDCMLEDGDEDALWNWHGAASFSENWLSFVMLKTIRGDVA